MDTSIAATLLWPLDCCPKLGHPIRLHLLQQLCPARRMLVAQGAELQFAQGSPKLGEVDMKRNDRYIIGQPVAICRSLTRDVTMTSTCQHCNEPLDSHRKFCGTRCRVAAHRAKKAEPAGERECLTCKLPIPSNKRAGTKFCSRKCSAASWNAARGRALPHERETLGDNALAVLDLSPEATIPIPTNPA